MKLLLATANPHKVEEFARLFAEAGIEAQVRPASEAGGMPDVEENAPTFAGNACIKARALHERAPAGTWVLADDSGLEVAALGGEPGIHSARYAGANATDAENRAKLLRELEKHAAENRSARFVCILALIGPDGREQIFEGVCRGRITRAERGKGGFGYDPLFVPDGFEQTFAEVDPAVKDQLSHRGDALRKLFGWLRK